MQAPLYAALWIIPVLAAFFHRDNLWITALGNTFTAHAVGSVIWLYTIPMSAVAWYALIPQVLVERILFASGMVIVHYAIMFAARAFQKIQCLSAQTV